MRSFDLAFLVAFILVYFIFNFCDDLSYPPCQIVRSLRAEENFILCISCFLQLSMNHRYLLSTYWLYNKGQNHSTGNKIKLKYGSTVSAKEKPYLRILYLQKSTLEIHAVEAENSHCPRPFLPTTCIYAPIFELFVSFYQPCSHGHCLPQTLVYLICLLVNLIQPSSIFYKLQASLLYFSSPWPSFS